jgi:hypothetical protein
MGELGMAVNGAPEIDHRGEDRGDHL